MTDPTAPPVLSHRCSSDCDCQVCEDAKSLARELTAAQEAIARLTQENETLKADANYARRWRSKVADRLRVPMPQAEGRVWQAVEHCIARAEAAEQETARLKTALEPNRLKLAIDYADERTRMQPQDTYMSRWRDAVLAALTSPDAEKP